MCVSVCVSIGEDILIFTIRARLQVLPTKSILSTWYPSSHEPHCILHSTTHDNCVQLQLQTTKIYKHSAVEMDWFNCAQNNNATSSNIPNTPDITIVDVSNKKVTIVELACFFDLYMDICFNTKLLKYQPLANSITNLGFNCTLIILIFGTLGHVHKLVLRGLQCCGLTKPNAKRLAKYCSISATIGSLATWRRRCNVYP